MKDDLIMLMIEMPTWMHDVLVTRAEAVNMTVSQLLQNMVATWCGHTITPEDKTE